MEFPVICRKSMGAFCSIEPSGVSEDVAPNNMQIKSEPCVFLNFAECGLKIENVYIFKR